MWSTARAEDGENCGNHPQATDSLTGATRNWPTPSAHEAGTLNQSDAGGPPQNLAVTARTWSTPSAHDGRRPGSDATSTQGMNLKRDAERWPTPNVPNGGRTTSTTNHAPDGSKRQIDLGAVVSLWQTPATDSFRRDEMGLDQQGRNWITPNARDWKSETGSERNTWNKTPNLSRQVYRVLRPDPAIPDGPTSSAIGQTSRRHWYTPRSNPSSMYAEAPETLNNRALRLNKPSVICNLALQAVNSIQSGESRRLNPRFVEWLLGLPIGWTEL
jgi:hypothetical protein